MSSSPMPGSSSIPSPDGGERPLVSIVSPVYNEEAAIEEFLRRTIAAIRPLAERFRFEIVLVNDGSRDGSLQLMKALARSEPRLRIIDLDRNHGQSQALQAGIDAADGEILVTLDSDLQHFPEEIPGFIDKLIAEDFDMVCGWRHERVENLVRRWPSRIANYLIRRATGVLVHDVGTTFRAYRADLAKQIRLMGEQHRFIPALASGLGARITELPITNIERQTGKSNYGLGRTTGVFLDIIFLHFIFKYLDRPMRLFGRFALALFMATSIIALMVFLFPLIFGFDALKQNSTTILALILIGITVALAGIQMLLTGMISEIIVRIHFAQNDRPLYRVRREWRSSDPDL